KRQAMPAVAITDTGNLFGVLEFATTMSKAGVQPIVGCILSIRRAAAQPGRPGGNGAAPDQLLLLVQDATGYRNLLALVSKAYLETEPHEPPQIAWGDLAGRTEGLIALTGGPAGTVGRCLAESQAASAEEALLELKRLFPERLYVEIQ